MKINNNSVYFAPEDFKNVITIEDLTDYLIEIIIEIRKENNEEKNSIIKEIEELQKLEIYNNDGSYNNQNIISIYKKIQSISLKLREKLSKYISTIDLYDSIGYALYYNSQRYYSKDLDIRWLKIDNKGNLLLQFNKAIDDIEKRLSEEYKDSIRETLNSHYMKMLEAIQGTYKGEAIGSNKKGAKLNYGHIAEAFERHLSAHHSYSYKILNNLMKNINSADKILISNINWEKEFPNSYWEKHEQNGIDGTWKHVRASLGIQRGTVAGDVGNLQVKSSRRHSRNLQLSSLNNLKLGIETYSELINDKIPIKEIAKKVANYLTEPLSREASILASDILNQEIEKELNILDKELLKDRNIQILRNI